MADAIVIGAGMAGLTAARELGKQGLSVKVVEGRQRIGGRVHSIRDFCDEPVEGGAEFVHGTGAATWPDVRAAGLATRPCPLMKDTMFNVGGGTRWLPWIIAHPGVWPTFTILQKIAKVRPPDVSARQFIEQQGYRGRARILAEMTLTAHLPGTVDEIGLQGLVEDGVLSLETGMNSRVDEGYDRLPSFIWQDIDVDLEFDIETIEWGPDGVTVCSKDGRRVSAGAAISTLPVGVLKSGKVKFSPDLPLSKQSALQRLEMGPVVKLLLLFKERFWPSWAANIGCGTGPVTLYWPTSYKSGREVPVLTAYATGPRAAHLSKLGEEEARDVVLADLKRLFPKADPAQLCTDAMRIDWGTDPFARGGYTFIKPGGAGARALLGANDTPPLFWAGSATIWSPIAATVEAAFSSGLRAAREVGEFL